MRGLEHSVRPLFEFDRVALTGDGKAAHVDAFDRLDAFGQLVLPRDVVTGAGREDFDLDVGCEMLGHVPSMLFGAAVDLGAVPLNDDRDLHWLSSEGSSGASGVTSKSSCEASSPASNRSSSIGSPGLVCPFWAACFAGGCVAA